ncbi:MAG: RNase P modulator RnpM [Acutalibacter sp.]|jgi:predicted RNA-binding protein YlxR (DUF448 family)
MMRPKKTPMRQCAGCGQMKPKKELVRLVRAPQKEEGQPPQVSLDLTGKKPGRGAYLCRDTQCLKQAKKSRRLERSFGCKLPEEVYARLEEELQAQQQTQEQPPAPQGPVDEQGRPIIVIEDAAEALPHRKGEGHG